MSTLEPAQGRGRRVDIRVCIIKRKRRPHSAPQAEAAKDRLRAVMADGDAFLIKRRAHAFAFLLLSQKSPQRHPYLARGRTSLLRNRRRDGSPEGNSEVPRMDPWSEAQIPAIPRRMSAFSDLVRKRRFIFIIPHYIAKTSMLDHIMRLYCLFTAFLAVVLPNLFRMPMIYFILHAELN